MRIEAEQTDCLTLVPTVGVNVGAAYFENGKAVFRWL